MNGKMMRRSCASPDPSGPHDLARSLGGKVREGNQRGRLRGAVLHHRGEEHWKGNRMDLARYPPMDSESDGCRHRTRDWREESLEERLRNGGGPTAIAGSLRTAQPASAHLVDLCRKRGESRPREKDGLP